MQQSSAQGLLRRYLAPQRGSIVGLVVLLVGGIALELAGPQIIRVFIDDAVAGEALGLLLLLGGVFLATALLRQGAAIAETFLAETISWTATNQVRADLTRHCLGLDRAFHQTHTPGELIERIDGDVTKLANFFARLLIQLAANVLVLLGVVVLCFGIDWRVGLALLRFSVVSLGILYLMRNAGVAQWATERRASADLFGFIEERLSGTEDIRAFGAAPHVLRHLAQRTRHLLRWQRRAGIVGSATFNMLLLLLAISTAGSLGLGGILFAQHVISIGTVCLIYSYTLLLSQPIENLGRQIQEVQEASASLRRVQELLATPNALPDGVGAALPTGALEVRFADVTFAYADGAGPVLHDINFTLPAGTTLGIVGRTGSGKSTLARLLFRLHDPTAGGVFLGDVDLRQPHLADLRDRIGMVTQDIQLFHASVRNNLTFFDHTISDERIAAILDDLGLDRATEQAIEHAIDRLMQGRTGVIIAHRLATLDRADLILLLENGRIVEFGPREQLASAPDSRFAALLRAGMTEALA